ncbi:signal peptidase i [Agrilactobacillus composti DSM 18527 = JCM 14202]|uniref:Signal peptidase I n=1 Tax=Agrilactobacillus composti DSM 18527 = JCM 14202 TaxID=1423734 RepID=X0PFN0_9LACO|nr:signal peptidase i [Agrilactobacillus composti DSM 18527 = JCM 14202]GAF40769.1 signal peptidase I [Agrilactobacillus composti DSM 18527 = JCM 14202]
MNRKTTKKPVKKEDDASLGRFFLELVVLVLVFAGIGKLLMAFVFANEQVEGPSMQPTFESGDRIIANRHSSINRGDIVILKAPDEPGAFYIKRVVGMPGENIASKNDTMYINGKKLKEPYLNAYKKKLPAGTLYTNDFTYQGLFNKGNYIPKDQYFVMGDHRNVSKDSRMLGTIKKSDIIGVVKLRYWPLNKFTVF